MIDIININDDAFKGVEAIIQSMTIEERRNPDLLSPSRKNRIARGSGKNIAEINAFIKQFDQMKQMMKMMKGGGAKKMMRQMEMMQRQGKGGFPGM